ncbi:XRN 5'-3' exonuclease N-terminus-domain-containing protein [Pelagophyceae sp. CCMP2097]|nr:XRN 5'-3' exonuclease N-terminus-domain-containing protein [Pelagophyceae sp. CCMP2097]
MGVPRFFRWISERYPKINSTITDLTLMPEFDTLYLDMNGIIHACSHPSDDDVCALALTEREICEGIFASVDRIVSHIVRPKRLLYVAVDGVAPRAKLNQQRSRRFGAAQQRGELRREAAARGDALEAEDVAFDSNCITPGTDFMIRVGEQLRLFINRKLSEGEGAWADLETVIFSGADVPGEGEHKIMQYIRETAPERALMAEPTRHCMYGNDADLIMLALATHEPRFTLLREVIDFNANNRNRGAPKNVRSTVLKQSRSADFELLHISILREYIQLEFCVLRGAESGAQRVLALDLERLVDDFVFITFFVGNDFLPHSPSLDIGEQAFDRMFGLYKDQIASWNGGYLTKSGAIENADRLAAFISALGAMEPEILRDRAKEEALRARRDRQRSRGAVEVKAAPVIDDLDYREAYYLRTLGVHADYGDCDAVVATLAARFVEGLAWCLQYYAVGCVDWRWFYPCHYCPMLADVDAAAVRRGLSRAFSVGAPLRPLEQLLACLPPASARLLPDGELRNLMLSPVSPIVDFYPAEFDVDMDGKRNPWEGVNLLPFLDADRLTDAVRDAEKRVRLAPRDAKRLVEFGAVTRFTGGRAANYRGAAPMHAEDAPLFDVLGASRQTRAVAEVDSVGEVWLENGPAFACRSPPLPPAPGFPSLHALPLAGVRLRALKINCFGSPSRYETATLDLAAPQARGAADLQSLLGTPIFVNWPNTHEALLVGVTDASTDFSTDSPTDAAKVTIAAKELSPAESALFSAKCAALRDEYLSGSGHPGDGGVDVGAVKVLLRLRPLQGLVVDARGNLVKVYGRQDAEVPLQLALKEPPYKFEDARFSVSREARPLKERFRPADAVVAVRGPYAGCVGVVVSIVDRAARPGVVVEFAADVAEPPFGLTLAAALADKFAGADAAALELGLSPPVLGAVCGSVRVHLDADVCYDVGLRLRLEGGTFVASGYCRLRSDVALADAWKEADDAVRIVGSRQENASAAPKKGVKVFEYSAAAIRAVAAYAEAFPELFDALSARLDDDGDGSAKKKKAPPPKRGPRRDDDDDDVVKFESARAVYGDDDAAEALSAACAWLANLPLAGVPRMPTSTYALSAAAVAAVQRAADKCAAARRGAPSAPPHVVEVGPHDVRTRADDARKGSAADSMRPPRLGDRIVSVSDSLSPLGARGTVVAIHAGSASVDVVFDEPFVGGATLQGACAHARGRSSCAWASLTRLGALPAKAPEVAAPTKGRFLKNRLAAGPEKAGGFARDRGAGRRALALQQAASLKQAKAQVGADRRAKQAAAAAQKRDAAAAAPAPVAPAAPAAAAAPAPPRESASPAPATTASRERSFRLRKVAGLLDQVGDATIAAVVQRFHARYGAERWLAEANARWRSCVQLSSSQARKNKPPSPTFLRDALLRASADLANAADTADEEDEEDVRPAPPPPPTFTKILQRVAPEAPPAAARKGAALSHPLSVSPILAPHAASKAPPKIDERRGRAPPAPPAAFTSPAPPAFAEPIVLRPIPRAAKTPPPPAPAAAVPAAPLSAIALRVLKAKEAGARAQAAAALRAKPQEAPAPQEPAPAAAAPVAAAALAAPAARWRAQKEPDADPPEGYVTALADANRTLAEARKVKVWQESMDDRLAALHKRVSSSLETKKPPLYYSGDVEAVRAPLDKTVVAMTLGFQATRTDAAPSAFAYVPQAARRVVRKPRPVGAPSLLVPSQVKRAVVQKPQAAEAGAPP